ncbi:MAG: hypothetical protein EXS08_14615 [Planctomycetes bacterium]|nr:hypothetical protein [Planctomycetota bacterium]
MPGLGHWLQGRRLRAALVFLLLVGLFAGGTFLAQGANLSRERHFYYWSGQFLIGGPALLAEALSGHPLVAGEIPLGDVGLLYACMAGLLNVLAMLDVFSVAETRRFTSPAVAPKGPPPESFNRLSAEEDPLASRVESATASKEPPA